MIFHIADIIIETLVCSVAKNHTVTIRSERVGERERERGRKKMEKKSERRYKTEQVCDS